MKKHVIRKYIEYNDAIGYCYFRGTEEVINVQLFQKYVKKLNITEITCQ